MQKPGKASAGATGADMDKTRSPRNLAKMLAYVLGRRPDEFGLIPDADGFVKIKDLLKALHEETGWGYVNESHLRQVLITVPAPAFECDAHRIRARLREDLPPDPEAERTPKLLYTSIRRRAYPSVHASGIHPSSHPRVILAAQREWAERLGRRIDPEPVILTVNVRTAEERGVAFARFGTGLFLAEEIPAGCFSGPALPADSPEKTRKPARTDRPAGQPTTPGSFALDRDKAAGSQVPESVKRRTRNGRKIDPKRRKRDHWSREAPPWKKN
jgi:putative RNA 2'-phosphotransferase